MSFKKSLSTSRNIISISLLSVALLGTMLTMPSNAMEIIEVGDPDYKNSKRCCWGCCKERTCEKIEKNIEREVKNYTNCRFMEYFYNWYNGNGFFSDRKVKTQ